MAIVTVDDFKMQSRVDGDEENDSLQLMLDAAQAHINRLLGFKIEAIYGGDSQPTVPPDLQQCVLLLATHWYEFREAGTTDEVKSIPFGVEAIVNEHREWSF